MEPEIEDATLLGTAMVASVAAGLSGTLQAAAMTMQQEGSQRKPDPRRRAALDLDYRIFRTMLEQRQLIDKASQPLR